MLQLNQYIPSGIHGSMHPQLPVCYNLIPTLYHMDTMVFLKQILYPSAFEILKDVETIYLQAGI